MKIERVGDETHITVRQSWLNTFLKCPEQARLDMMGLQPRVVTDAMAIGSALHRGVEILLCGEPPREALLGAVDLFDRIAAGEDGEFRWVQVKSRATALNYVRNALISWAKYVHPTIASVESIEQSFVVELDRRGKEVLFITGTWDLAADGMLWDWKTANREWDAWEAQRYFVQPTSYCLAYFVQHGRWPTFRYVVHSKGPRVEKPQLIDVERNEGHVTWLANQSWRIYDLYVATDEGTKSWPLMDQGWHCSPKWCSAFASCKGAHLGENPW